MLLLTTTICASAAPAVADLTLFAGAVQRPATQVTTGAALGLSLAILGIEFEYSAARETRDDAVPSLDTGMVNLLLQTPFGRLTGFQLYVTAGGGVYRERLDADQRTGVGTNVGGGVKIGLVGPLRLRLDYRLYALGGPARHERPSRFYAGLNLAF